ncbi:MAG: hypothetical protein KKD59_04685 [Acidobacteria bacterium]|nr:hypothetical protein [Acidobacteriota bacterium]
MKKSAVLLVSVGLLVSCGPLNEMATQRLIQEITWAQPGIKVIEPNPITSNQAFFSPLSAIADRAGQSRGIPGPD